VVEARFIIVCERSSDHQMSEAIGRRKHGGVCFGIGDYSSSLDPRCFSLGLNGQWVIIIDSLTTVLDNVSLVQGAASTVTLVSFS